MTSKDNILAACTELIEQNGSPNVTIRAINQKLKISSLSFYHFFASKKDLMAACLLEQTEKCNQKIDLADHLSPKQQLLYLTNLLLTDIKDHPNLMEFVYFNKQAVESLPNNIPSYFAYFHQRVNNLISRIIPESQKNQEARLRIWSIINGAAIMIKSGFIEYEVEIINQNLLHSLDDDVA
jgi:AcrR family transcriptional regulator